MKVWPSVANTVIHLPGPGRPQCINPVEVVVPSSSPAAAST